MGTLSIWEKKAIEIRGREVEISDLELENQYLITQSIPITILPVNKPKLKIGIRD